MRPTAWPTAVSLSVVLGVLPVNAQGPLKGDQKDDSGLEVETDFAAVNGTRLFYEVAGTGDPIVLIHGNFGDRRYYDGQFEALAGRHRVLRYDLRGYGQSMLPEAGFPTATSRISGP